MTKQKSDKQALDNIVESAEHLEQVYKRDSQFGDLVIITTQNSVYSVSVIDDDRYLVSVSVVYFLLSFIFDSPFFIGSHLRENGFSF